MDDFQSSQIENSRLPTRTYLITYSQGDLLKFLHKKNLGNALKPISRQQIYGEKKHAPCYTVICCSRRKKERRSDRFGSLCAVMHQKALNDLIESTWEMQNRKATLEREKTSRKQVLEKVRLSSCVDGSDMEWYISHVISCRKTV